MSRDSELDQNLTGDFQKDFSSDLNEIWYVRRGRWVMHDGMPYGRNQGQGHSREVDRQSPTGLIFNVQMTKYISFEYSVNYCSHLSGSDILLTNQHKQLA